MNILTFLTEGRGFTFRGRKYSSGGSKTEKKYYCDKEEISQMAYEFILKKYRESKISGDFIKEKPVAPAVKHKKTNNVPENYVPSRIEEIQKHLQENDFVPSKKSGIEGRKENLERINKMLNLPFGINFDANEFHDDESVEYTCKSIAMMAKKFPFLLDHRVGGLTTISSLSGFMEKIKDLKADLKNTKNIKICKELIEEESEKKLQELISIVKNDVEEINEEKKNFFGCIYADTITNRIQPYIEFQTLSKEFIQNDRKFVSRLLSDLEKHGIKTSFKEGDLRLWKNYTNLNELMNVVLHDIMKNEDNFKAIKNLFVKDSSSTELLFDSFDNNINAIKDYFIPKEPGFTFGIAAGLCGNIFPSVESDILADSFVLINERTEEVAWYKNKTLRTANSPINNVVAVHEMGHSVENRLKYMIVNGKHKKIVGYHLDKPIVINGKEYNDIIASTFFNTVFEDLGSTKIYDEISGYGASAPEEMLAEAIRNYYCDDTHTKLEEEIVNAVNVLMQENFKLEYKANHPEIYGKEQEAEDKRLSRIKKIDDLNYTFDHEIESYKERRERIKKEIDRLKREEKKHGYDYSFNERIERESKEERLSEKGKEFFYENAVSKEGGEKIQSLINSYYNAEGFYGNSGKLKEFNEKFYQKLLPLLKEEGYNLASFTVENFFSNKDDLFVKGGSFILNVEEKIINLILKSKNNKAVMKNIFIKNKLEEVGLA